MMIIRTTRTIIAIIIALRDRPWALDGIFMENKKKCMLVSYLQHLCPVPHPGALSGALPALHGRVAGGGVGLGCVVVADSQMPPCLSQLAIVSTGVKSSCFIFEQHLKPSGHVPLISLPSWRGRAAVA